MSLTVANYLLKSVQAWRSKGAPVFAISIQNEPTNNNPTYPTAILDSTTEAAIAVNLRSLLDANGLPSIRIVGSESNWIDSYYPGAVMSAASNALAGVSFHCYSGSVDAQTTFHNSFPNANIFQTECADIPGTDW